MPATFEPLATTTLASAASSITFSSIPSTYTDLVISFTWFANSATDAFAALTFNNDSGANYGNTSLYGSGSAAGSMRDSSRTRIELYFVRGGLTIPSFSRINIFNYRASVNKSVLIEGVGDQNGSGYVERMCGVWLNTSPVTTVTLTASGSNFNTGTTATLYGIKSA